MLSSDHRLPKEEIAPILRRGTRVRSDIIELVYRKTNTDSRLRGNDNNTSRFAFIVSTKIDKRATARNKMRRTMSESVRLLLPKIGQVDGIFIAKKNFSTLLQPDVEKIISRLLSV